MDSRTRDQLWKGASSMTTTTMSRPATAADLVEAGFTAEQIERLERLRSVYPMLEFLTTPEVRRLEFLKWRRLHEFTPTH